MRRDSYKEDHMRCTCVTCDLSVETCKIAGIYAVSPSLKIHATACNKARKLKITLLAGCNPSYLQLWVLLHVNCMYFCLQRQAILPASRGQICMSSACKITCKIPVLFRQIYMRLQAIRVYSERVACRVDAGKFT